MAEDPRFKELKSRYKDRGWNDFVLAVQLKCFRNAEDLDIDWYPESADDYARFTDYLNRPIDNTRSSSITKEYLNDLYKAMTTLYSSPRTLENRLNLISRWFSSKVDRLVAESPMLGRESAIRSQEKDGRNGYQSIMDEIFAMVKEGSTLEGQKKIFDAQNPNASDALWESKKAFWQNRADEFAKIYENKELLAALAAPKISAAEGIAVNIDGITFDIKENEIDEVEDSEPDEDNGIDNGEAQKGERFVDFRTLSIMSTLSTRAKTLISKLNRTDANGNIIRDDIGYPLPLDIRQTAIALHRTLRLSEPGTMMDDLNSAVSRYPDLRSLVEYLRNNPDDRSVIYSSFKKAKSNYYYGYKNDNGRLDVHSAGNVAEGFVLASEAGANISIGAAGSNQSSVVDESGNLKDEQSFNKLYDRSFYQDLNDIDWQDYKADDDGIINELAERLVGLGFQVSADDVKTVFSNYPSDTRFNGGSVNEQTPMEYLSTAMREVYDRGRGLIKIGDDLTGSHLYNYAQDSFTKIAEVLSPIQKGETEERIISGDKSLSVYNTPNALHQLIDSISNAKGLSREDYKESMMREYGQYESMGLGFGRDVRLTGWLADASGDTDMRWRPESFRLIDMTDSDKKDYASLTSLQHLANSYAMYARGAKNKSDSIADNGHMYEVPIQADYETAYNFVFAPGYSFEQLVDRLTDEVECEAQRIAAIKERIGNDPADPNAELTRAKVSTYEKRGTSFQIFPEMNSNGFTDAYAEADPIEAHEIARREVENQLRSLLAAQREELNDKGFFSEENMRFCGIKSSDDASVNGWILNSFYARQQITKLLYGGLESFKNTADFEKRNMYAHATRIPLYTEATYKGEKVGKKTQRAVYISDDVSRSYILDKITRIAEKLENEKKISGDQKKRLVDSYKEITSTDGQGVRTLDSMRRIKIMASLWTDADESAYKHIKSGEYTPEDVEHFMVGLKPIYTGYEIIPAQPGQYQKPQRVPVLHKYSEMVLLPELEAGISLQNDSVPFQSFNKINDKLGKGNEIDLFIFGSGVKIGGHSLINAFAKDENGNRILKDSDSISDFVSGKIKSGNFWVHELPLKYYGIAAATHADVVDKQIAWASQAEKEAWANILPDEKINVNGREMPATEARELYHKIKEARTIDTFKRLRELFYSDHKLAETLKAELASKPYQSREISFILQMIDGEGSWNTPLYQPSVQHDAVALLSSILEKRLTKVPTKGANIIQTSGFGMDMDASGFDNEKALKDSDKLEVKFDDNGNLKYVEAYAPIYDSRLLQFADEWGNISPDRLNKLVKDGVIPESALYFIAYRTPSDAEHSIIPCRIKGFVANTAGASIRLPKEIMPMTGHDYDGDKLRCHFKEFYVGWNDNLLRKDFEKFSDTEAVKAILSENDDATLTPYEVFRNNITSDTNPDSGKYRAVREVRYDYGKTPLENINNGDYSALNNALVDLMFAQLTSPDGGMKMFIPGGNAETTMYANIMRVMRAYHTESGRELISDVLKGSGATGNPVNIYNHLLNMSESKLGDLVSALNSGQSPFTVTHATDSHEYMMDGAGMIGVYAVYNSSAAMFQRLNLSYKPTKDKDGNDIPVSFFGKTVGDLWRFEKDKPFPTLGLARLVNAAVDNGKNPVLGYLNQTAELAPLTNFLFAAGLSEEEIHLMLNQPVLVELGKRLKDPNSSGFMSEATRIQKEILNTLPKDTKIYRTASLKKVAGMSHGDFAKSLGLPYQSLLDGEGDRSGQIMILQSLQHIYNAAMDLDSFTKLARPESNTGSLDASLGGTMAKIIQLDEFRSRMNEGGVAISGIEGVIRRKNVYFNSMTPWMLDAEIGDALPEVSALNTLLKDAMPKLFREKFPQMKESWQRVTRRIAGQYTYDKIPGKVVDRIQSDMILWKLLSNSRFTTGDPQAEQRRVLISVPNKLAELKERIQRAANNRGSDELADRLSGNVFLNNLELGTTINEENEQVKRIRFKQNGPSVEDTADLIRSGWDQLWREPETRELAEDLFKYNLYTNGFSYGRYEFYHYAPFSVLNNMEGYKNALMSIRNDGWSEEDEEQFYHQYMMNHWGDKSLFKKVKPDQLPIRLRTSIGLNAPSRNSMTDAGFIDLVGAADYIIIPTKVNGKTEDKLYRIIKDQAVPAFLEEAQKLGIRNRNNQVMVQYNPKIRDYHEVKPFFKSNNVSWETKQEAQSYNNEPISDADRQAAIDDIPFDTSLFTAEKNKALREEAEKAANSNGKLTAEQAASFGLEDEPSVNFYLVEHDENGNPIRKGYPATPGVVRKAREQQVFVELNKRLRKILEKVGVSIGQLDEAEARLGAGGVSDFSRAKVLAEGMKELIRLSNGIEGEYALPEEFAHVAVEMLGRNHPLVSRLVNAINNDEKALEEAYGGMLDEYKKQYGDDREKLVVEAAGKLVAKQLLLHQQTKTNSVKNLVKRVCEAIKDFFRKISHREVEEAILDAEGVASQLARDLLSGRIVDQMSFENITTSQKFLNIEKDLSDKKDIMSKLLANTLKRIDILQRRLKYKIGKGGSSRSLDESKRQLEKLEKAAQNQKLEVAIVDYLNDAMAFMKESEKAMNDAINNLPANAVCRKLNTIKDTMYGFAQAIQAIKDARNSGELKDEDGLKEAVRDVSAVMEDFWNKYHNIGMIYFKKFLSNVYGDDGVTINVGKNKGKRITIDDMATHADHDISFFSRWLHAASDINDFVIQAMDRVTRDAKMAARDRVRELRPRFEAAFDALVKEQGNRETSWMYERKTESGKTVKTGKYITAEAAKGLSKARQNYYKVFMELMEEADKCVPDTMTSERHIIMFRKQHYEKLKEAKGIKGIRDEEWENVKRNILEMGDVDYENEQVIKDFNDNIVDQLPLKFLRKGKDETFDDMTDDTATALMAYLGMAFEYKEMNNVIGMLENARYMSSLRDVDQRRGLKGMVESVGDEKGFHYTKPYTVKQANTLLQEMMNDFFSMHVYGHLQKEEGTFGNTKISKRKAANVLGRFTSLSQMAANLHQRIANVNTGFTQILVESFGGKIKAKDVRWAIGVWVGHGAKRMSETGKTDYADKLSLWMDKFDIHQDNGIDSYGNTYGKKRGSRVFNSGLLYAGLTIGEDFMSGTTALALARQYKLKGPNGEESNIWDAYEVKYTDETNKTGAYLVLKDGYTKEDGSPLTAEDERKFQREVIGTNFELQGIYNKDDRSAIQQYAVGSLAIMYRKWIAPALKRRYGSARYSNLKDDFQEGYYTTTLRLLGQDLKDIFRPESEGESRKTIWQILTDIQAMKNSVNLNWNKLTDYEKGNVTKAFTEIGVVLALVVASGILTNLPPDDHDGNKLLAWADDIVVTQLLRLRSEIGSQAPTPMFISEALRIFSTPFASLRVLKDSLGVFQLIWPVNYWEEVQSGRYKGKSKAYKYFMKLPIISMFRKFDNFVDPSPLINYYKNSNY